MPIINWGFSDDLKSIFITSAETDVLRDSFEVVLVDYDVVCLEFDDRCRIVADLSTPVYDQLIKETQ